MVRSVSFAARVIPPVERHGVWRVASASWASMIAVAVAACSEPPRQAEPPQAAPAPAPIEAGAQTTTTSAIVDAAAPLAAKDAGYEGPRLAALFMETPIMSDMEWPVKEGERPRSRGTERAERVMRIGYIRQGSRVPVVAEPHKKANCNEGWYELVAGGFVCGKYATLDASHPRVRTAPHAPNLAGPLPYDYGYNLTNGTPLYRQIPSREERLRLEPWFAAKAKPRVKRVAMEDADEVQGGVPIETRRPLTPSPNDPFNVGIDPSDAGVPWYLREYDGGKPIVTLDELKGEGPVVRRMVRGFYLALDKEYTANGSKWWKTTGSLLAPYDRVYVPKPPSDLHGVWLRNPDGSPIAAEGDDAGGPRTWNLAAFVVVSKAKKYTLSADGKALVAGDIVPRLAGVRLTGESMKVGSTVYEETDEGWWLRINDARKIKPAAAPNDVAPNEKWVDVNLTTQSLVAYVGKEPVFATLVSSGKRDLQDKEKDHPTPTGTFRIREKHIAATMDGDHASDGPYSIEDVPWIMYFSGSYALHGAFWHNSFGHVRSHGCVNLAPADARTLFGWTDPPLPEAWHAVWATPNQPGTRVVVHE